MFENLPQRVKIVEVGPRDGLQNEAKILSVENKVKLIELLVGAGLKHIEVTSFVSPKWIPQLADGLEVAQKLDLPKGTRASALVPNQIGYEKAKQSGLPEIALFMSATESHSRKNINKSIAEAFAVIEPLARQAKSDGKLVRAYLSVVFACPYEGEVEPATVVPIIERLARLEVDEISLGDTIGAATPSQVQNLLSLLSGKIDFKKLALHFHDTRGMALVNVMAGLSGGITIFDASVGGMGGCPYAPGASGNLATEDLVYLLESLAIETGVDLNRLVECGRFAEEIIGRNLPGRYLRARLGEKKNIALKSVEEKVGA
jgi:hydroxymethylglutaryl-CoA lyase